MEDKKPFKGMAPVSPEMLARIKHIERDISYAQQSESQKMDIYWPDENEFQGPYPTVIYFHGGAFLFGDKNDQALEPMLRGVFKGYVVVSVEYRKSKEARFPAMVYDAKAAIRFLRANASELKLDPSRFAVWGPSSGGWLVSMLGVTDNNPAFEDLSMGNPNSSSSVQAVVDWCGPCGDFAKMDDEMEKSKSGKADHNLADSPESLFLGASVPSEKELSRLACPITYVNKNIPPFLLVHGGADQIVPVEQSIDFASAINRICKGRADLRVYEGKLHHGASWYHEEWLSELCYSFISEALKK